jgi:hypothetical protein
MEKIGKENFTWISDRLSEGVTGRVSVPKHVIKKYRKLMEEPDLYMREDWNIKAEIIRIFY